MQSIIDAPKDGHEGHEEREGHEEKPILHGPS
jgi:hypothetical protein